MRGGVLDAAGELAEDEHGVLGPLVRQVLARHYLRIRVHTRGAHELGIVALVTRHHQLLSRLLGRLVKLLLLLLLLVIYAAINIHRFSFV